MHWTVGVCRLYILKLLAAASVLIAATSLGRQLSYNLEQRPAQLRDWLACLAALETEIQYAANPLPEALARASETAGPAVGSCLRSAAAELRHGAATPTVWQRLLQVMLTETSLLPADVGVLAALGQHLGMTDSADQTRHLRLCRSGLEQQLAKAEAEAVRLGRLYRYGGPLAGCAAVLLLL